MSHNYSFNNRKEKTREELIEELEKRYGYYETLWGKWTFLRKKYAWIFVVATTKYIKRGLDIVVSFFLLIFLSPVFLVISVLIWIFEGRPILYISKRVGRNGRLFNFPKFRTMHHQAEEKKRELSKKSIHRDQKTFKIRRDPRTTRLGYLLRRSSLDELPQLWSVFKGDMSLVGPRPALPEEVAHYRVKERTRLDITPGITCFWQVSGRSDLPFDQQISLDMKYIQSQNFLLDCKILLKTIPAVFFGKGAY
ncbi:MAG: exopolysaccharide biosynthesis polyprenyl glycosylphosphotransferase [Chlamydiales bacterium]